MSKTALKSKGNRSQTKH